MKIKISAFAALPNNLWVTGKLVFDASKADGTPRKLQDVSRMHSLGWRHSIDLEHAIRNTFEWFMRTAEGEYFGTEMAFLEGWFYGQR